MFTGLLSEQHHVKQTVSVICIFCVGSRFFVDRAFQAFLWYSQFFSESELRFSRNCYVIMYQSIPAVNISPRATPGICTSLLPSPPDFYLQICARGVGLRRGQIFPEMNEYLLNIFIFRGCFQEAIQNGRKTLVLFTQIAFVS